jgi:RiboL-PSP-HEPN
VQEVLGSFDADWQKTIEAFLVDEFKDAVDSVVNLRNKIAHGESVGVTYQTISEYYIRVQRVVDKVADLCVPH